MHAYVNLCWPLFLMQSIAGCLARRLAMPRTYIRKTAAINEDDMKKAIVDVEQNSISWQFNDLDTIVL